jgi:preprotein translocase subunit SecF
MQIFTDTNFDFMGKKVYAALFSGTLLLLTSGIIIFRGLTFGIDFRGGTEIELKFAQTPDIGALRSRLEAAVGGVTLQPVGRADERTVLVRAGSEGDPSAISAKISAALLSPEDAAAAAAGRTNLNQVGKDALGKVLFGCGAGISDDSAQGLAEDILAARIVQGGVLAGLDSISAVPGITPEIRQCLERETFLPPFTRWKDYYVGPKVGAELRTKAIWAIAVSLAGILIYLTFRFQFEYGVGAVVALFHDVIITTGLLALLGVEFDLTVVAALLTLAGYSVNDTIVVFDRIRDNLRIKRTAGIDEVINLSLNQTLSRTILTGGTSLMAILSMLFLGGTAFYGFSLALLIGIIKGTYSSIFVASPIVVVWQQYVTAPRARRVARA